MFCGRLARFSADEQRLEAMTPTATEKHFALLLERRLAPVLIADDFLGQDWTWSRLRQPVINCIQIQPRSDRIACSINLGVHLTLLPVAGGSHRIEWPKVSQPHCEIQSRLAWEGESEHWWRYEDGEDAVNDLVGCYQKHGKAFFGQFDNFPHPFVDIEPSDIGGETVARLFPIMTKVRKLLLLARVHDYLGDSERTVQFSHIGKETAGPAAGPKAVFRELLRKYESQFDQGGRMQGLNDA